MNASIIIMERIYTIYKGELPDGRIKIGCDEAYPNRPDEQSMTNYFILEQHEDIMIASEREIQLQKEHGVRVDGTPYYMTKIRGSRGAKSQLKNGIHNFQKGLGRKGFLNKEHQLKASRLGGLARKGIPNPAAAQFCKDKLHGEWTCETCGKTGKGAGNYTRYHKNGKCQM